MEMDGETSKDLQSVPPPKLIGVKEQARKRKEGTKICSMIISNRVKRVT